MTILPDQDISGRIASTGSQSRYNDGFNDNHQASQIVNTMSIISKNILSNQYHMIFITHQTILHIFKRNIHIDLPIPGTGTSNSGSLELVRTIRR